MQRIHCITTVERDAILASSYLRTHTVVGNKVMRLDDGWQGFEFEPDGGGIGAPPMEYDIQVGDMVTIWWLYPGPFGHQARAISVNGGPVQVYPQELGLAEGWVVAVVEEQ